MKKLRRPVKLVLEFIVWFVLLRLGMLLSNHLFINKSIGETWACVVVVAAAMVYALLPSEPK